MSRQSNRVMDGLIPGYGKIRKRGCSSSPSSSSKLHNYRFKRAIMVGKTRVGGGSRSSTPAPSWRMTPSSKSKLGGGGGVESPNYDGGGGGRSRPVSARKLAATLWEMNEMPSPQNLETRRRRKEKETTRVRDKTNRPVHTPGSLPPHLSDPSHSPVSERMDRSGTGSHHRISFSQRAKLEDNNGEVFDSLSNSSLMEIETRSRAQTPSGSTVGVKPRLKDVSNALTTSKELLKIIHRMWAHDNLPSSSMSLISALHTELERARLQVNQVIKDQRVDHTEINYLLKCFAEEKASWKTKERRAIEAAIESIAAELEVERKLRRRSESLNKKLGVELAETKASFTKALKELESEKRAREIMEQVCDELAVDIGEDRAEAEELKRESVKVHEEVEREREMLQLADKLREERVQMKLAEAKHQFEEKNALVDKLRSQLEAFLGNKGGGNKKKGRKDEDLMTYMNRTNLGGTRKNKEHDDGEVENGVDSEEEEEEEESGGESDLHSIELNMDNNNKSFKWNHAHNSYKDSHKDSYKDSHKDSVDDELKWRNLVNGKASRRSTSSIQRNISDGNEWGIHDNFVELEKQTPRRSHGDELQRYKSVKNLRDRILTNLKPQMSRDFDSVNHGSGSKSRSGETRSETINGRRSKK